ncbi:MAG: YesN/AraC family two-component response regulator [Salibacteraceae bacterium]|jgi:YesN/AraC family two-component response regulator
MKALFILIAFVSLSFTSNSQKLDPFFKQDHDQYNVKIISDFYFQKESNAHKIVLLAEKNSKILKEQDYYLYFLNELTRTVFIQRTNDIKGALQNLEILKKDPILRKNKLLNAYYNNVSGNVYFQMQSPSRAIRYYLIAVDQFESIKDSIGWQGNLMNVGNAYAVQNKPDSAFIYYNLANHLDSLGIKTHHWGLITNLARYYYGENQFERATEMYEEVYEYSSTQNDHYTRIISCLNLGECYFELHRYEDAILVLQKGKKISIDRGISGYFSSFERTISQCYASLNKYEMAYYALFSTDSIDQLSALKDLEEFAQNLSVKHQKEIRQKEKLLYRQEINRKKGEQQLLLIFLIVAVLLLILILIMYFQKRKKNQSLARQNFKLADQHLKQKNKKVDQKKISNELIERIESYLLDEKKFRNSDLTLDKLAKSLNTNRTYISENINAYYGFSFSSLLNKLRIDDARCLLIEKSYDHFSIAGIATSVGYRNLSSFNVAFKKESGITPSYFRSQNKVN